VKYLSHVLLTNLLLGDLKASAPSRIINVSSRNHKDGHIDFDDLQEEKNYSSQRSYSQSKLALILFTRELVERVEGTDVTVNAMHPGAVATNWSTHSVGLYSLIVRMGHPWLDAT
jgi:NAD(P)-dependent dehydrogenase (short-subunit alcohol dehydrogenase family)